MAILPTNLSSNTGGFFGEDGFNFDDLSKGLTGLAGLLQSFGGLKGLDLAKDQFNFSKDAFGVNLANQAKLTNSQLETRQRSRNARGVGIPLDEYMARFGVSGSIDGSTPYGAPANPVPPTNTGGITQQDLAALANFGRRTA